MERKCRVTARNRLEKIPNRVDNLERFGIEGKCSKTFVTKRKCSEQNGKGSKPKGRARKDS